MPLNHRAKHGKPTPGHISMVIEANGLLPGRQCACGSVTSVHTSEGGTEKLLALTVHVQWERASMGSRTPTGPGRGMVARVLHQ